MLGRRVSEQVGKGKTGMEVNSDQSTIDVCTKLSKNKYKIIRGQVEWHTFIILALERQSRQISVSSTSIVYVVSSKPTRVT